MSAKKKQDDIPIDPATYLCMGAGKQECNAFATFLRPDPVSPRIFIPLCAKHASKGE